MLRKAKRTRIFEDVVVQIQDLILEGQFRPGDRLPSERELGEVFQISRNTLREAIRALEQKGLVEIKTGFKGGCFIRPISTNGIVENLDLLLRYEKISLKDLSDFREEVEAIVIAKAASVAGREDVEELKGMLEDMRAHLPFGVQRWNEVFEIDRMFHLKVAQIAKNKMYESVLHTLYENINRYFTRFLPKDSSVLNNTYEELNKITEAIEKNDPDRARMSLIEHVRHYYQMMEPTHS